MSVCPLSSLALPSGMGIEDVGDGVKGVCNYHTRRRMQRQTSAVVGWRGGSSRERSPVLPAKQQVFLSTLSFSHCNILLNPSLLLKETNKKSKQSLRHRRRKLQCRDKLLRFGSNCPSESKLAMNLLASDYRDTNSNLNWTLAFRRFK